jgi:hydroxysqualene synthase
VNGVQHYENFPVASVLCPPPLRPAVTAIYHFARTADDIADEGDAPAGQRLRELQAYREDLRAIYDGRRPSDRWSAPFGALDAACRRHALPQALLSDLLDAFMQDVRNPPYPDRAALLDYCRRSANPIGRLLLHLYGVTDPEALRQSDAVCSALQLINFWQDLGVDLPRGRCYVPQADAEAHGVSQDMLRAGRDTPQTRALVRDLVDWSQHLMLEGSPLARAVPGRAGWELRLVVQGGLRIVEKMQRMDFATLSHRPTLGALDLPLLLWRTLAMRP